MSPRSGINEMFYKYKTMLAKVRTEVGKSQLSPSLFLPAIVPGAFSQRATLAIAGSALGGKRGEGLHAHAGELATVLNLKLGMQ